MNKTVKKTVTEQNSFDKTLAQTIDAAPMTSSSTAPIRISAIARNAFREAVRDRVLYNLVVFVLLLTAAAAFLGELTAGHEARVIVNLGLHAMRVFGTFIAIFVGIGLVSKEIEKRTIFAIFSKPVSRGEFLIGKYLGLCLTLLVNVLVMGAGVSLALLYVHGGSLIGSAWAAIVLIFLELAVITAVAILFSSFSSPALSALLTFFVFLIGHFSQSLKVFADNIGTASARFFFNALYYFLPNLEHFNVVTHAAHGNAPAAHQFFGAIAYAAAYIVVLLTISILIFSRRNFK
jgi:ABC-type transport system involved in multi-copper enzyme maturation permease subunit